MSPQVRNRWSLLSSLLLILVLLVSCAPTTTAPAAQSSTGNAMDELVKAAKAEGTLTTIALPHDWCNYGEAITNFKAKYGLEVNELNPDGGSGDEIEAIKANKDNKGPQAPDVIDVGYGFGPQIVEEKLVQAYKVSTWDTIPADSKDADGYWYGDYYGVLAFEVNKDAVTNVPQDWADLLKPEYKGQVALSGDPRASAQAQMSVYAAALANGGSLDDVAPGLEFFKKLNEAGNFVPLIAKQATVAKGETPVIIALGLQCPGRQGSPGRQPDHRGGDSQDGRHRRRLHPGHQRVRAASQRRQAVDGVPLLR